MCKCGVLGCLLCPSILILIFIMKGFYFLKYACLSFQHQRVLHLIKFFEFSVGSTLQFDETILPHRDTTRLFSHLFKTNKLKILS